jgi:hypothetical protein
MRATDGFGFLPPAPAPPPRRSPVHRFCLDATTFWCKRPAPRAAPGFAAPVLPATPGARARRLLRNLLP